MANNTDNTTNNTQLAIFNITKNNGVSYQLGSQTYEGKSFGQQISNYVQNTYKSFVNEKFSTYAMSLLSDIAAQTIGGRTNSTTSSTSSQSATNAFLDYVTSLGHTPKGIFGKNYPYIYLALTGNNKYADETTSGDTFNFPHFTFYGDKPNIVLADVENDWKNYFGEFVNKATLSKEFRKNVNVRYSEENGTINGFTGHGGDVHGNVESFNGVPDSLGANDLIFKTNYLFNKGKIKSLVARFHSTDDGDKSEDNPLQTAISSVYGMSHGRNLLARQAIQINGYDNPYCRTWTYHHQYKDFSRAIRPLTDSSNSRDGSSTPITQEELYDTYKWSAFGNSQDDENGDKFGGKGRGRLDKLGVLSKKTGRPNITPITTPNMSGTKDSEKVVDIKNCMFSIENLAWKVRDRNNQFFDENGLSVEQKGPMGGRIMWFPPYNIKFSEDVKTTWGSNSFIGRGEKIYTYGDTERNGRLEFDMLIDHPSVLNYWKGWEENGMSNRGTGLYSLNTGGVDNRHNQEQTLLRFFAGCDILEAEPKLVKVPEEPVSENEESNTNTSISNDSPAETECNETILCFVYFPNAYSGKDDGAEEAINYLLNGFFAQTGLEVTKEEKDGVMIGMTIFTVDNKITVRPNAELKKLYMVKNNQKVEVIGGYEKVIGRSLGNPNCELQQLWGANDDNLYSRNSFCDIIPVTKEWLEEGYELGANTEYPEGLNTHTDNLLKPLEKSSSDDKGYSTINSCYGRVYYYGQGKKYLAMQQLSSKCGYHPTPKVANFFQYRWLHRVDNDCKDMMFNEPKNYADTESYGFNSRQGYGSIKEYLGTTIDGEFHTPDDARAKNIPLFDLISFADLAAVFLTDDQKNNVLKTPPIGAEISGPVASFVYDDNNVKLVNNVFESVQNVIINVYGNISDTTIGTSHEGIDKKLAQRRVKTVCQWLKNSFKKRNGQCPKIYNKATAQHQYVNYNGLNSEPGQTTSDYLPKLQRHVLIEIKYKRSESVKSATDNNATTTFSNSPSSEGTPSFDVDTLYQTWEKNNVWGLWANQVEQYFPVSKSTVCKNIATLKRDISKLELTGDRKTSVDKALKNVEFLCTSEFDSSVTNFHLLIYYLLSYNGNTSQQYKENVIKAIGAYYKQNESKSNLSASLPENYNYGSSQDENTTKDKSDGGKTGFLYKIGQLFKKREDRDIYFVPDENQTPEQQSKVRQKKQYNKTKKDDSPSSKTKASLPNGYKYSPRYDNEGEFFKELQTHDPNMFSLISQKVRYFEPTYHSISPEGFAARLTFLQQCTRQGNTVSASDTNRMTANNLSFGAPPVCVLRLGDFYYTRIIIESLSINYDPLVWDLNHEGIGVMPMMAHISMNFHFIGGSDLGGPISRLQNAVSFNYYANTSTYDNRAEQIAYGENGEISHFKPFEVDQRQNKINND